MHKSEWLFLTSQGLTLILSGQAGPRCLSSWPKGLSVSPGVQRNQTPVLLVYQEAFTGKAAVWVFSQNTFLIHYVLHMIHDDVRTLSRWLTSSELKYL